MKNLIISSLISAVIGYSIPYIGQFIKYLYRRRNQDNLCSQWYSYSLMTEKNFPQIFEGTVKISKGILSLYKSEIYENGLLYKGSVSIENNHILMIQKTNIESRSETSCIRLDYSEFNTRDKIYGYWLSYDSDNYISCGTIILSKRKLNQIEALTEMKANSVNYENLLLRLSK